MNIKNVFIKFAIGLTLMSSIASCGKGDDNRPVLTLKEATKRLAGKKGESKTWDVKLRETQAEQSPNIAGYKLNNLQFYFLPDSPLEFMYNLDGNVLRQEIAKLQNAWMPYEEGINDFVYETIESKWYWSDKKKSQITVLYLGDNNEVYPVVMTVKRLKSKSCVLYYTIDKIFVIQDLTFEK